MTAVCIPVFVIHGCHVCGPGPDQPDMTLQVVFSHVLFDGGEALVAETMLHAASVLVGDGFIYAEIHQHLCQNHVFLIDILGDSLALRCQRDVAVVIYDHISVFAELLHGYADGGLGKTHFVDDIDGPYRTLSLFQHVYHLKIIFCRLSDLHPTFILLFRLSAYIKYFNIKKKY